ncbi:MAG: hypothetical protein P4L51_04035 [Puia sp.]|nr:hypothetical protein [Puia sp.]
MKSETEIKPLEIDEDKDTKEDRQSSKTIALIFFPLAAIAILTFKFSLLRSIVLYFSAVCAIYLSYSTFKKNGNKLKKENLSGVIFIVTIGLAFFSKFFTDLFLTFLALLFSCFFLMALLNFKVSDTTKNRAANYVFFGAIITAVILNYDNLLLLLHRVMK